METRSYGLIFICSHPPAQGDLVRRTSPPGRVEVARPDAQNEGESYFLWGRSVPVHALRGQNRRGQNRRRCANRFKCTDSSASTNPVKTLCKNLKTERSGPISLLVCAHNIRNNIVSRHVIHCILRYRGILVWFYVTCTHLTFNQKIEPDRARLTHPLPANPQAPRRYSASNGKRGQ